ncbi:hypothetical protein WK53_17165 [Burkholderia ubonensis]|uniref:Transposase n=1 Tax=Burkholderia ubonensis TaxID=101571 RepID=A0AAW3N4B0_9BURK|nr:hypothetical protein WK53_17165 [Burkholderia ubonensis]
MKFLAMDLDFVCRSEILKRSRDTAVDLAEAMMPWTQMDAAYPLRRSILEIRRVRTIMAATKVDIRI